MSHTNSFVAPSIPVLRPTPPVGPGWLHEVKFDGWRVQFHKQDDGATIFSRNGTNLTPRFHYIRDSILMLPARSVIIDAEIVVCDTEGKPDFDALIAGSDENLCAWCFDLLEFDDRDLRRLPLTERKRLLNHLLIEGDDHVLRYSAEFPDPIKLLAIAEKMGLEGIVSKLANQPYHSGKNPGWVKVKTKAWREANRDRWEHFVKRSA